MLTKCTGTVSLLDPFLIFKSRSTSRRRKERGAEIPVPEQKCFEVTVIVSHKPFPSFLHFPFKRSHLAEMGRYIHQIVHQLSTHDSAINYRTPLPTKTFPLPSTHEIKIPPSFHASAMNIQTPSGQLASLGHQPSTSSVPDAHPFRGSGTYMAT